MSTKLIIGADTGIANAMTRALHARGDSVVAATLKGGADLIGEGIEVIPDVDVTSDEAVATLAKKLTEQDVTVSWLVHVAGVMFLDSLETFDFDDARRQFEINTLGPLRVIRGLQNNLADDAKVGILTSRVGSIGDNTSGGDYAYRISKAGANMVARNLSIDLGKRGIAVQALHPGTVNTHLLDVMDPSVKEQAAAVLVTPESAAAGLIDVLDNLTLETAGQFQRTNGEVLPW
ncbi:SDR family oxidoreductase [Gordonia sp. i37]|uniref:1-hydroxy-2-glutathionyl-2-methyl-3-butene dehydrogenase n=1 Tax=Gordonia sp. i37 TaxID=1961707 RepID=UPI0009ABD19E|nr:SDR family oxidoreductase [Gordonia sp. i37]OPX14984.1 1-hydroxy-2-glutathionyl-2-methyl-3-butene dehydrogenase [Gordonia sp. i37]